MHFISHSCQTYNVEVALHAKNDSARASTRQKVRGLVNNLDWHMYTLGHRLHSKCKSSSHSIHENTEHKMCVFNIVIFGVFTNLHIFVNLIPHETTCYQ